MVKTGAQWRFNVRFNSKTTENSEDCVYIFLTWLWTLQTKCSWYKNSDYSTKKASVQCSFIFLSVWISPGLYWPPGQYFKCADTLVAENQSKTDMPVFPPDTLCECLQGRRESEWTPCGVARRRVRLSKARWSYLPTDDSCIVLYDSSVWKVLWIQSQMPPLLWYSCLDTKSTWTSIWSQHAALHVRQPLSQNRLFVFFPLSRFLLPSLCISLSFCCYKRTNK